MKSKNHSLASIFLAIGLPTLCLIGCTPPSPSPSASSWQSIAGRDHGLPHDQGQPIERPLLYRALVPENWIRKDPLESESIADTTKANCTFMIVEEDGEVRLTVYTFPYTHKETRIPPQAQITRWKKQIEELDLLSVQIVPDSHGGFSGLYFEGQGKLQNKAIIVMGWSMRLAHGYDQQLAISRLPLDHGKRADYTIKANGPPDLVNKHRLDIIQFAHSFELIDELPSPL
jgi:hypothetical protein